jgi:hypothetical protein
MRSAPVGDMSLWANAQTVLCEEDAAGYSGWPHVFVQSGHEANYLTITAPMRFNATYIGANLKDRVLGALRRIDPTVRDVRVVS